MPGPLNDIRVVDFTHALNGPFCTMLLGHLGAEVIKIEPPQGDNFRRSWMGPDAGRDGYEFLWINVNKKSVVLNLKSERGVELARGLIAHADVLVENYQKGTMERFGLDYDSIKEAQPAADLCLLPRLRRVGSLRRLRQHRGHQQQHDRLDPHRLGVRRRQGHQVPGHRRRSRRREHDRGHPRGAPCARAHRRGPADRGVHAGGGAGLHGQLHARALHRQHGGQHAHGGGRRLLHAAGPPPG